MTSNADDIVSDLSDTATFSDVMGDIEESLQTYTKATKQGLISSVEERVEEQMRRMLSYKGDAKETIPSSAYMTNFSWGHSFQFAPHRLVHKTSNCFGNLYCFYDQQLILMTAVNHSNSMVFKSKQLFDILSHNINYVLAAMHFFPIDIPSLSKVEIMTVVKDFIMRSFVIPVDGVLHYRDMLVRLIATSLPEIISRGASNTDANNDDIIYNALKMNLRRIFIDANMTANVSTTASSNEGTNISNCDDTFIVIDDDEEAEPTGIPPLSEPAYYPSRYA